MIVLPDRNICLKKKNFDYSSKKFLFSKIAFSGNRYLSVYIRINTDKYGWVRMRSDAFGWVRMISDVFGWMWGEDTKKAFISEGLSVIRLGLEPRTPTLKVLCSTCWASESSRFGTANIETIFLTPKFYLIISLNLLLFFQSGL